MDQKYPLGADDYAKLDRVFTYHKPQGDQPARYEAIREICKDLAIAIKLRTPVSREQSLAMTKLEEVVFWANAAIARNEVEG